jgi:hypothetical protein
MYPGFGDLNQGPTWCSQSSRSLHPPPHLLCQWPFFLYTKQGSDSYEFICTHSQVTVDMNSYFLMYEFISGGAMCEVPPSLWRHLTHQPIISLLPRPIRVRSAVLTSLGAFGCPDQLGCVRLPPSVRVRTVGGVG